MINLKNTLGFIDSFRNPYFLFHMEEETIEGLDCDINYPEYKSNAGFDGWLDKIYRSSDFTKGQIAVMLLRPEEDHSWVIDEQYPEIFERFQNLGPFQERANYSLIKNWVTKERWGGTSFEKFFYSYSLYKKGYSMEDISKLRGLELEDYAKLHPYIKGVKYKNKLSIMEDLFGKTNVKLAEGDADLAGRLSRLGVIPGYINPDYWDKVLSARSLYSAGVPLSVLFPRDYKDIPRKEFNQIVLGNLDSYPYLYSEDWFAVSSSDIKAFLIEGEISVAYTYADTYTKIKWVMRNEKKLLGTREVQGPGGQTATFHMHRIVSYLNDEDLPRKEYTGWKHVMSVVEDKIKKELDDQLGVDRPLPMFPEEISDRSIRQVVSTTALKKEGEVMGHCVAGYIGACDSRTSYIFHVKDGTELGATVEVCGSEGNWFVAQSMNYGNRPSEKARKIMEGVLGKLQVKQAAA